MKTTLITTVAIIAALSVVSAPAHAWHTRGWTITTTTITPPPSVETIYVDPDRHSPTPAENAAWCKVNYCPPEIPLR